MAIIPSEFKKNIVIDTPQRKKTKKLAAVLAGIMIFTVGIVYFGFFSNSGGTPDLTTLSGVSGGDQTNAVAMGQVDQNNKLFESLKKATLDNPILKDKKFQSLILSDRLPVVIGEKGRQDPFAAF